MGHLCIFLHLLFTFTFQVLISKCTRLKKLDLSSLWIFTDDRLQQIEELVRNNPGITWFGAPIIVCFYGVIHDLFLEFLWCDTWSVFRVFMMWYMICFSCFYDVIHNLFLVFLWCDTWSVFRVFMMWYTRGTGVLRTPSPWLASLALSRVVPANLLCL